VLSALGYGGAVFYALRSDNFHDFFTEYVPFGEDVVLWFEERSFQRRFPNARQNIHKSARPSPDSDEKVKIPWKSGLSWKAVDEQDSSKTADVSQKGRHMSAVDANSPTKKDVKDAQADPAGATPKEINKATEAAKAKAGSRKTESINAPAKPDEKIKSGAAKEAPSSEKGTERTHPSPATPSPKSDPRPPALAPVERIPKLEVPNADEPVVQELVKILNDLITVVNADTSDATNKLSAPMTKAKESLTTVASQISALRDAERKAAEERVQQAHKEFDEGAKQLLQRIETAQREDEARFREEFETERAKIAQNYEQRLKNEVERTTAVAEQRLKNQLSEQAIELKQSFVKEIQSLVEEERGGRLSKLTDLSSNVDDLTQLTSNWNGVIDTNLATQKLQVAVDSVRAALAASSYSESKPKPFVREMAALKLVADGDAIVDAAIASINPAAYQKGIPSQPQLIDRFRRVAGEVRKASLLPEDAGIASHAASFLLSNVMFKKNGQPQGSDVESILTRTENMLEEGNIDGAARELNGLKGWGKILSQDLLSDMRKVLEVRQALEVIEAEARLQCLRVE
jgi:MICOS complex subunit MIC60